MATGSTVLEPVSLEISSKYVKRVLLCQQVKDVRTRERENSQVLKYYHENGRNKYRTCQRFGIAKGFLYQWLKKEKEIHDGRKGSKRVEGGGRKPFWPDVEEKLLAELMELRVKGLKVKQLVSHASSATDE
jgi:hypothetical protein